MVGGLDLSRFRISLCYTCSGPFSSASVLGYGARFITVILPPIIYVHMYNNKAADQQRRELAVRVYGSRPRIETLLNFPVYPEISSHKTRNGEASCAISPGAGLENNDMISYGYVFALGGNQNIWQGCSVIYLYAGLLSCAIIGREYTME